MSSINQTASKTYGYPENLNHIYPAVQTKSPAVDTLETSSRPASVTSESVQSEPTTTPAKKAKGLFSKALSFASSAFSYVGSKLKAFANFVTGSRFAALAPAQQQPQLTASDAE